MNVLHLSGATYWGGNEQQMFNLIRHLSPFGVENMIFCYSNTPVEACAKKNSIPFISMEKTGTFSRRLLKKLIHTIKMYHIDVIHIHTSGFVGTYMLADIRYRISPPVVFSKKGISDKSSILSPLKYNYKGIRKIICVSEAVRTVFKHLLSKKNHDKMVVIYDGIDIHESALSKAPSLRDMLNLSKNTFLIGNIANHSQAKDLATFVKTAAHLVHQLHRTDIHFVQIGQSSKYTPEYLRLVEAYQLSNYISFIGFSDNAKEMLSQFDICLITSKTEGLPLVVYEAFLKKAPVVSTTAGGIAEVITHNENGFLTAIGDDKNLAHHVDLLLNDAALRKQFIAQSYTKVVHHFDAAKLAKHTYNLYQEILNETG